MPGTIEQAFRKVFKKTKSAGGRISSSSILVVSKEALKYRKYASNVADDFLKVMEKQAKPGSAERLLVFYVLSDMVSAEARSPPKDGKKVFTAAFKSRMGRYAALLADATSDQKKSINKCLTKWAAKKVYEPSDISAWVVAAKLLPAEVLATMSLPEKSKEQTAAPQPPSASNEEQRTAVSGASEKGKSNSGGGSGWGQYSSESPARASRWGAPRNAAPEHAAPASAAPVHPHPGQPAARGWGMPAMNSNANAAPRGWAAMQPPHGMWNHNNGMPPRGGYGMGRPPMMMGGVGMRQPARGMWNSNMPRPRHSMMGGRGGMGGVPHRGGPSPSGGRGRGRDLVKPAWMTDASSAGAEK